MGSYEAFKRIRNQIRKIDPVQLAKYASLKLREVENKNISECNGYLPWYLLLIIRWGFEHGGQSYRLREVNEQILIKVINLIHDFENFETNHLLQEGNFISAIKYLRTIAFQQFWIQDKLNSWQIARQKLLIGDFLSRNNFMATVEESLNGLSIDEFFSLSFVVWAWIIKDRRNLICSPKLFFDFDSKLSEDKFLRFFTLTSRNPDEIKSYLTSYRQNIKNPYFQLTEISPLVRYPFLALDNEYLVYSQKLYERFMTYYLYNDMKLKGGSDLVTQFGYHFEEYINRGLSALGLKYYREEYLKRQFPQKKVADFLIPFSDCNLVIESKAIEMKSIVRVNPVNEALHKEFRDSIIKGVIQGYSLIESIANSNHKLEIKNVIKNYLMIITYQELYLGDGDIVWQEFLNESVSIEKGETNIDTNLLPPENIFFLSIAEFDTFISVLLQGRDTATDILTALVDANKKWDTKNFSFSQHIDKYIIHPMNHPFLDATFSELTKNIVDKN